MKSLTRHINESLNTNYKTDKVEKVISDLKTTGAKVEKIKRTDGTINWYITLSDKTSLDITYSAPDDTQKYDGFLISRNHDILELPKSQKKFFAKGLNDGMYLNDIYVVAYVNELINSDSKCECILSVSFKDSLSFNKGYTYNFVFDKKYDRYSVSYDDGRHVTISTETFKKHFKIK